MPTALVLFLTLACRPDDECTRQVFYADADGDGHGDPGQMTKECEAPDGFAASADDCDDAQATVYPGAEEICDGLDNDCDQSTDVGAVDKGTWYVDADGDGFGTGDPTVSCTSPGDGYAPRGDDCDDVHALVNPDQVESCNGHDDDCDELVDDEDDDVDADNWFADADGDHYGDPATEIVACEQPKGYIGRGQDCDDTTRDASPEGEEICDEIDNDCDGLTDADDSDTPPLDLQTFYVDADADGYGDPDGTTVTACDAPSGYVLDNTDCTDDDAAYHEFVAYYKDNDGDGYGNDEDKPIDRCIPGDIEVALNGDCDDADPAINPGAPELCANGDENCNDVEAEPDPAILLDVWYFDADGDSFGDASTSMGICNPPVGYVADSTDCDDTNAYVFPGAPEVCDSIDNDCNKVVEDDVAVDWYVDADGDGYGDGTATSVNQCDQPSGYVRDSTDCDDVVGTTNPGAPDLCANGVDDDCDLTVDNCLFDITNAGFVFQGNEYGGLGLTTETGDFDGDGSADDILMGAQWADKDNGAVYVVMGPQTGTMTSDTAVSLSPVLDRSYFGAVIGAGDANSDAVDDVLVTPFLGLESFLFLGPVTVSTDTSTADAAYGVLTPIDLEVVGNFDGDTDTSNDVVVVSDNVFVFDGSATGTIAATDATQTWSGGMTGGYPIPVMDVEELGDVDGDGVADLAMGSTQATEGVIWVVPGGLGSGTFVAQTESMATIKSSGEFASCIVTADIDGDGALDLIADAPEVSESVTHDHFGAVYAFLNDPTLKYAPAGGLTEADADTDWESAGGAGKQMATGDFDGDGNVDLAMGNPYGEYAQGFVFVDFGPIDSVSYDDDELIEIPGLPNEWHGRSLGAVADWTGDGGDDLVIGAQALGATGIWGSGGTGGAYVVNSEDLYYAP